MLSVQNNSPENEKNICTARLVKYNICTFTGRSPLYPSWPGGHELSPYSPLSLEESSRILIQNPPHRNGRDWEFPFKSVSLYIEYEKTCNVKTWMN